MAVALTADIQKHIDEYQHRVGRSYLDVGITYSIL